MAKQRSSSLWLEYTAIATVPLVLVLGNSMLVPILPEVKRHLHLTQLQTSLIITLFSVSAGLIIPIAGYLSDRFGRKAIIIPSLIVWGGRYRHRPRGVMGILRHPDRVPRGQGLGAAGTASIAMALVGDLYKDAQESQALGLIEASNGTGKVISPILGSALALWTWTAPFLRFPYFAPCRWSRSSS